MPNLTDHSFPVSVDTVDKVVLENKYKALEDKASERQEAWSKAAREADHARNTANGLFDDWTKVLDEAAAVKRQLHELEFGKLED